MDALPVSLVSTPPATVSGSPGGPSASGAESVRGVDFADLLSQTMALPQRQELAAAVPAGLQSLALSPNFQVITADEPLPDSDSLLAFARGQGLDESMIRSLFQPAAAVAAASAATLTSAFQITESQAAPVATLVAATGAPLSAAGPAAQALSAMVVPLAVGAGPSQRIEVQVLQAPAPQAEAAQAGRALTLGTALAHGTALAQGTALVHGAALPLPVAAQPSAAALGTAAAGLAAGVQALAPQGLAAAAPAALAAEAVAPDADPVGQVLAAAQGLQAAGAADRRIVQDFLRLRLNSYEHVMQRLGQLAATGAQARWAEIQAVPQQELLQLSLGGAESLLGLEPGASAGEPLPAQAAGGALPPGARPQEAMGPQQPLASQAEERAARYEQLAERLGQALGQRLQAQIEKGQWKVQMQVDPQSLGRIEMELEMRAGALEAVFRSDNQSTRDLIVQGLPRLRESLAQSGTAVASVWVQSDSGRQSGGNPTPGRDAFAQSRKDGADEMQEPVAASSSVRASSGDNAWDVLA